MPAKTSVSAKTIAANGSTDTLAGLPGEIDETFAISAEVLAELDATYAGSSVSRLTIIARTPAEGDRRRDVQVV